MLTRIDGILYNPIWRRVGGELDSTEIVRQRLHVEAPPTSLKRWNKLSAEQLPVAA